MEHRVLLVDDEPKVLTSLARTLEDEPFAILFASSAAEARERFGEGPIDAVVSDHEMPGASGTQLLSWVHENHPDVVRLILTGHATLEVAIEAINEGAVHRFLTKPCNPVDLAVTLRQGIQQKELAANSRRLLASARRQNELLSCLEESHPGITRVERDAAGAFVLEGGPLELDALIGEMDELVERIVKDIG